MIISDAVDFITNKLNSIEVPASTLPARLLRCVAWERSGLSAYKVAAKIIENNKILGIPTDPNPDGSANMINQYTYNVVKCIFDAIKNDAVVHSVTPMSSLLIQVNGANAGGALTATGTNLLDSISKGIIR
jgi:hypothetical protein